MIDPKELDARKQLLAKSWDEAAPGYEVYFVPRFEPWTTEAIRALAKHATRLPSGPALVPCCGPGQELLPLALALGDREVLGIDLSPGMIVRARARIGQTTGVWAEQGDACSLETRFGRQAGAVLSCFGLQQLPEPERALEDWGKCLQPGGVLSVMMWTPEGRDDSVFDLLKKVIHERSPTPEPVWPSKLPQALANAGLETLEDRDARHGMEHENAGAFFDALAQHGPLHSLVLSKGHGFAAEVRRAFVAAAPKGRIEHEPKARFILARRSR